MSHAIRSTRHLTEDVGQACPFLSPLLHSLLPLRPLRILRPPQILHSPLLHFLLLPLPPLLPLLPLPPLPPHWHKTYPDLSTPSSPSSFPPSQQYSRQQRVQM